MTCFHSNLSQDLPTGQPQLYIRLYRSLPAMRRLEHRLHHHHINFPSFHTPRVQIRPTCRAAPRLYYPRGTKKKHRGTEANRVREVNPVANLARRRAREGRVGKGVNTSQRGQRGRGRAERTEAARGQVAKYSVMREARGAPPAPLQLQHPRRMKVATSVIISSTWASWQQHLGLME